MTIIKCEYRNIVFVGGHERVSITTQVGLNKLGEDGWLLLGDINKPNCVDFNNPDVEWHGLFVRQSVELQPEEAKAGFGT